LQLRRNSGAVLPVRFHKGPAESTTLDPFPSGDGLASSRDVAGSAHARHRHGGAARAAPYTRNRPQRSVARLRQGGGRQGWKTVHNVLDGWEEVEALRELYAKARCPSATTSLCAGRAERGCGFLTHARDDVRIQPKRRCVCDGPRNIPSDPPLPLVPRRFASERSADCRETAFSTESTTCAGIPGGLRTGVAH